MVSTWLSMMGDMPVWPNPGRLGQYEAALAWSTDPARTTRWPEVRVPCLVLAFEHDVDSPPRYARQAAEAIPGCEYREVAGAGHIGILTHADEVARILIEFFARSSHRLNGAGRGSSQSMTRPADSSGWSRSQRSAKGHHGTTVRCSERARSSTARTRRPPMPRPAHSSGTPVWISSSRSPSIR